MISIIPEHIHNLICSKLIEIYKRNEDCVNEWNCTRTLQIDKIYNIEDCVFSKRIAQIICNSSIPMYGSSTFVEFGQIVKWNIGCEQEFHFDNARNSTKLVSITYLNDNFTGGCTVIKDMELSVKPETSKTLYFDGKKYEHCVTKVNDGVRYTLALWYTNDVGKSII